jgi:hypothetical protein
MSTRNDHLEAIEHVLRLRSVERRAEPGLRDDIARVREFIERTIGPTARAATTARLLGVSQTALSRWLDNGEIGSVLTPAGRREVPLAEVLDLVEDARRLDVTKAARPLTAVLRGRRRAAEQTVDIDRLLPRRSGRSHRTAELHALAYHRLVAERLDDQVANQARRRLSTWRAEGRIHPHWAQEWEHLLALPLPRLAREIPADTPHARELRQTSPFAGVLNEHERRRLVELVERRAS